MADLLDSLFEDDAPAVEVVQRPPVPRKREHEARMEALRDIEDDLLQSSLQVVSDTLAFRDIDPDEESPPKEWVEQLGEEEAWRRFRLAQAGWVPKAKAPAGAALAKDMAVGIIKARSAEKAAPRQLNIGTVNFPAAAMHQFPELILDDGEDR